LESQKCTFSGTGPSIAYQYIYFCKDCNILVCEICYYGVCHQNHQVYILASDVSFDKKFQKREGYCHCGETGCTLITDHVAHKVQDLSSSSIETATEKSKIENHQKTSGESSTEIQSPKVVPEKENAWKGVEKRPRSSPTSPIVPVLNSARLSQQVGEKNLESPTDTEKSPRVENPKAEAPIKSESKTSVTKTRKKREPGEDTIPRKMKSPKEGGIVQSTSTSNVSTPRKHQSKKTTGQNDQK